MNKTNHIKTYQVAQLVMLRKTHCLSQNELDYLLLLSHCSKKVIESQL